MDEGKMQLIDILSKFLSEKCKVKFLKNQKNVMQKTIIPFFDKKKIWRNGKIWL